MASIQKAVLGAEPGARHPQAARPTRGHAIPQSVLAAGAALSLRAPPDGMASRERAAGRDERAGRDGGVGRDAKTEGCREQARPGASATMKGGRRLRRAGWGSRARDAGTGGRSGREEAWEARRYHPARATHGVQQVERAQAVLGAREAPAHHGGAWASGRPRVRASSAGLGG